MFSTQTWSVESASGRELVVGALQKWVKDVSLNPFMLRMMWNIYLFFSIVYKNDSYCFLLLCFFFFLIGVTLAHLFEKNDLGA